MIRVYTDSFFRPGGSRAAERKLRPTLKWKLRLIRGGPGTGKTALVFRELKQALKDGVPARVVVPTATLVRHFQHELARDGQVFAPATVVSLARLVRDAAEPLTAAPPGLLRAFVRDALRRDPAPEFAAVAGTEGMATTVLDTIALFENAGAGPDRLAAFRRLKSHPKAFLRIWSAVAARVRQCGFASRPEIVRAAAARIAGETLWFDGFATFSPLEIELIEALSKTCRVTVTLADSAATEDFRRQALRWGSADRLLSAPPRRPETTAVSAVSPEREADEIARRIVELRDRGVNFREIGVGLRDPETYLALLRGTFERFGIPARYYFASPLRHHPAARFLGGLVRNVLEGWEFGDALDTLRAHPRWGSWGAFDWFDFKVREAMPGRGAEALLALCDEGKLKPQLAGCLDVAAWAGEKLCPEQWAARLTGLAESLYSPGCIDVPNGFSDIETLRMQAAGLRAWVDAVALAPRFWPEPKPVELAEFWRVASEIVDAASVTPRDERRDVVHVMNVFEVRQWDVAALFVCGMTDRDFPRKAAHNLLFPDADIDALVRAGIPLRKAADLERDEEALFDSLRGRARQSLVLTWPEHDAGGRRIASSRYIGRLLEEGRAVAREARLCRPEPVIAPAAGATGRIASPELLPELVARHQSISLTALEDLAQCRFKFFAGRTLGLKTRPERPQERLQARVTGLILHQALEGWLKAGRTGDFVPFFEAAFDEAVREMHLPEGYRLEVERIESRRIAGRVSATEQWIAPYPPEVEVELTLPFPGGVTVNCRIDRIDRIGERECLIVDYKSGKTKNVERFVESSVKLQGPLYALAVREGLGYETVAMMFHAVRDDRRFGWGEVPGVEIEGLRPIPERWIEDARERTVERLTSFVAGEIHAAPTEASHCRWCDYADVCRYEVGEALVMIEAFGGA